MRPDRGEHPRWLARLRRMSAALANHETLAPEDADALLDAINASAQSRWDDGAISIESAIGMPPKWRSIKRQIDQAEVIAMCVGAGYRGRDARHLLEVTRRYAFSRYGKDLESGRVPDGEEAIAFRLLQAYGDALPAVGTLSNRLK